MTMPSFDIVTAAGQGYTKVWAERHYLLKLAIVPVLFKFICFVSILSMDLGDNRLRASMILIPSYFAEGWMLAHWVRMVVLGQRWPFQPTGNDDEDMKMLNQRARGVLGGMIVYVLTQMVISGIWAWVMTLPVDQEALENPNMQLRLTSVAIFVFMLWAFRFLWLFIPVSANYTMAGFLKDIAHPKLSLYMIAVWLICAVPGYGVMMGFTLPVLLSGEEVPILLQFASAAVQVCLEVMVNLLAVAGIAYGLKDMYGRLKGKR